MVVDSILWRRLDTPGHDICRLERSDDRWELRGMAIFRQENGILAGLAYHVICDRGWRTREGHIRGVHGEQSVSMSITRTNNRWTLNGTAVAGLESCIDLDLAFTPATNLLALRRLNLTEGQAADAPAAWLDVSAGTLELLPQRYERRAGDTYWYEAPSVGYAALLDVFPSGFIRTYPGLWEAES